MVVDMTPHARDLLYDGVSDRRLTRVARAARFVSEDREWRFQAVRQIASLGNGASDRGLAMLEQGVEIVDERLHFDGVTLVHAPLPSRLQLAKLRPETIHRRQSTPRMEETKQEAAERDDDVERRLQDGMRVLRELRLWMVPDGEDEHETDEKQQSTRPQRGGEQQSSPQRSDLHGPTR